MLSHWFAVFTAVNTEFLLFLSFLNINPSMMQADFVTTSLKWSPWATSNAFYIFITFDITRSVATLVELTRLNHVFFFIFHQWWPNNTFNNLLFWIFRNLLLTIIMMITMTSSFFLRVVFYRLGFTDVIKVILITLIHSFSKRHYYFYYKLIIYYNQV